MNIDFSSLGTRLMSAAILVPLMIVDIYVGSYAFGIVLGIFAGLAIREFWRMAALTKARILVSVLGVLYIGGSIFLCYQLRGQAGAFLTLLFFGTIWMSDTGAYFFGKFIGGPKMAGAMSPNKTWSGYVGALLFPMILLAICTSGLSPLFIIVMGAALGVTGQAGDLLMSWFKRRVQVKDSGSLIPGHGGVLDRIDSLIPAVPVYMAFAKYGGLF